MRIATKLTIALLFVEIFVSVMNGWSRIQNETKLFESDMRRDHHELGRGLGAAVVAVWRRDGEAAAMRLVAGANEVESAMQLRAVYLDGHGDITRPVAPPEALTGGGQEVVWVDRTGEGTLYSYHPVDVGSEHPFALEFAESLAQQEAYVTRSVLRIFLINLLILVLSAAVTTVVGAVVVGRPASRLAEQTRRIGAGDLSGRLPEDSSDELGELARQLNAMTAQLELANQRIIEETRARVAALDQLRHADRLRTVGQLASGLAHELGTPLNVVAGRAQMVASGEVEGDEVAESARIIEGQAERMTTIIRQLLDFARARPSEKSPTNVADIAQRAVGLLTSLARKYGATLVFSAKDSVPIRADASQIHQALANLVVNASQAGAKQVLVRVSRVDVTDRVPGDGAVVGGIGGPAGKTGRFACIEVRDDVSGIAPDHLARLFEPFFTTKSVGEGTGLGLAVSWGIISEHGGFITVDSALGQGSTFTVYLPEDLT